MALAQSVLICLYLCTFSTYCVTHFHFIHVQIHSERDPSHVEDSDDHDGTAQQEMPAVVPGQDAVPSQSSEVTDTNT